MMDSGGLKLINDILKGRNIIGFIKKQRLN
jgi:hypothetical protein